MRVEEKRKVKARRKAASFLRGWVNYFHYRNSSKVLDKVRCHAEERLRAH